MNIIFLTALTKFLIKSSLVTSDIIKLSNCFNSKFDLITIPSAHSPSFRFSPFREKSFGVKSWTQAKKYGYPFHSIRNFYSILIEFHFTPSLPFSLKSAEIEFHNRCSFFSTTPFNFTITSFYTPGRPLLTFFLNAKYQNLEVSPDCIKPVPALPFYKSSLILNFECI